MKFFVSPGPFRKTLIGACAAVILASAPAAQAATNYLNIVTGGTSGVYYPMGVALSQIYSKAMPDVKVSVQATKASVENLNLLQAGRAELAFTLADSLSDAWKGNPEVGFTKPLDKLRSIAGIYSNYIQIVARADSGIKTLADLKGKRISVGAAKSGTELNARAILKAAGLTYKDFKQVQYLPFGESIELMKNHQLDVTLQSAGLGVSSIRDLANSDKIVIVPISADIVKKINDPAYQSADIPANTYDGQTQDTPTVAIQNFLVTRAGVSDEEAYQMTKAVFTHLDELVAAHAAAKGIVLKNAITSLPAPLHPGAQRYYKEVGLLK